MYSVPTHPTPPRHVGSAILVRHGLTDYNAQGRLQGQVDIPLNDVGRWQAEQTARALWDKCQADGATPIVVSSPLQRARATADVFAALAGTKVHVDERVTERSFGRWEGCTWEDLKRDFPGDFLSWEKGSGAELRYGAESRPHVGHRGGEALEHWARQGGPGDRLIVFSHGGWISQTVQRILHIDVTDPGLTSVSGPTNGHWIVFHLKDTADGRILWRLVEHNIGPAVPPGIDWNHPFGTAPAA